MPFEINFYSYLGILAIFSWSLISCSSLMSWMPHVFIICLHTCIWFHDCWTNICLYIFFEKPSGSCRICFRLQKLVSVAETDTSIIWVNGNRWMITDWMKMVMKENFIGEMKWSRWNEVKWNEVEWNEVEWNGVGGHKTCEMKERIFFFWKI